MCDYMEAERCEKLRLFFFFLQKTPLTLSYQSLLHYSRSSGSVGLFKNTVVLSRTMNSGNPQKSGELSCDVITCAPPINHPISQHHVPQIFIGRALSLSPRDWPLPLSFKTLGLFTCDAVSLLVRCKAELRNV